jgi:glycosyltransferase involved in cell wall biosynthesis
MDELRDVGLSTQEIIIVTHGCWEQPTRLGYRFKKKGFPWVYTPQGMLEPWSIDQKKIKKKIYFTFFEKRWTVNASSIRAVSNEEKKNLELVYNQRVTMIPNGVRVSKYVLKDSDKIIFLFLARLHHKKGVLPFVKAWVKTMKYAKAELLIAGPDEGELDKIRPFFCDNVRYIGPIFGDAKRSLLKKSHYYVLPSFSEGFPTSVVEAMGYGAIPLISKGCNFPEVFDKGLGYQIEPEERSISQQLLKLKDEDFDHDLSHRNHEFIQKYYSESVIGDQFYAIYQETLKLN